MTAVGGVMVKSISDQFLSEGRRYQGQPWAPLKESTLNRRRMKGRDAYILRDTGNLFGSIDIQEQTHTYVDVGTDVVYGATHQFGDALRNIPARPFLPETLIPEDDESITRLTDMWLQQKIDESEMG